MKRFGEFTLLEELGESEVADCFRAAHDVQGGPLFVKRYRRVDPAFVPQLLYRCEVLMLVQHPNLAPHFGHGDVDGVVFAVSPFLDGIGLAAFVESVRERRVVVRLEALLYILRECARAVHALHACAFDGTRALLAHGDVCTRHVRLGPNGEVWLTGLPTPRGLAPDRPPEGIWDQAGLGALLYDLIPLTKTGGQRPPLPGPLDRVVRRSLGIGPPADQVSPAELAIRLDELADGMRLPALEPRLVAEAVARAMQHSKVKHTLSAADALPTLEPVIPADAAPPPPIVLERLKPPPAAPSPAAMHETAPTARPPSLLAQIDADATEPPQEAVVEEPVAEPIVEPFVEPFAEPIAQPIAQPVVEPVERQEPPPRAAVAPPSNPPPKRAPPLPTRGPPEHDATPWEAAFEEPPRASRAMKLDDDERTSETPVPMLDRFDLAADFAGPFAERTLPPDPFQERTLPGHLVAELPSDEPAVILGAPELKRLDDYSFESASTMPEVARPKGISRTLSDPAHPAERSTTSEALKPALHPSLEVPREISALVKLDSPVREALGLLADPVDDGGGAFGGDPAVMALLDRGVVRREHIDAARAAQASRGGRLSEILVAAGATTDDKVADALAAESVLPRIHDAQLAAHVPHPELCRRLPQTYALARRALPLALDGTKLTLAVSDPFDKSSIQEIARLLGAADVAVLVAARAALTDATLKAYRGVGKKLSPSESAPAVLLCMHNDDEVARFGARLAEEGFHVEHARDVARARLSIEGRRPSAVVLAQDLPDAEGLLVFARGNDEHADMPVFVVGPAGDDAVAAHVLDLGADDYFERGTSLNVVMAKLRRALNKRGVRPEPPEPARAAPRSEKRAAAPAATAAPPPSLEGFAPSAELDDLPDLPPGDLEDLPSPFGEPTGVMGTLRQMAVTEIVQSLELGRKTARVEIVPTDGERGMVGFEEGRVVYAECGSVRGERAFYSLARHTEGFFRIRYGEGPAEKNIEGSTTFLLLEAMRLMDEEGDAPAGRAPDDKNDKNDNTPTPFD